MLGFLNQYGIRILSGMASALGLTGAVAGLLTGIKTRECAVLGFCAVISGLIAFVPPRKRSSRPYVSSYRVTFDDQAVVVTFRNKRHESVRWSDLGTVAITIEDAFLPQPYWMLVGDPGKGGCVYPSDAVGANEMLAELQKRLPGFDNQAVVMAMGMMSGGIQVWKRADGEKPAQPANIESGIKP